MVLKLFSPLSCSPAAQSIPPAQRDRAERRPAPRRGHKETCSKERSRGSSEQSGTGWTTQPTWASLTPRISRAPAELQVCCWKPVGSRTDPSTSQITFLSPSNACCPRQPERRAPPGTVSKQSRHALLTSSSSNARLTIKINRGAICRRSPLPNPGGNGAAEAAGRPRCGAEGRAATGAEERSGPRTSGQRFRVGTGEEPARGLTAAGGWWLGRGSGRESRSRPRPSQPHGAPGSPAPGRGTAHSGKQPGCPGPGGCFPAHPQE